MSFQKSSVGDLFNSQEDPGQKEGNVHIRRILIESAWTVIKHDFHLREKYNRIRAIGTDGNKAIVAVARSLAVRLVRCLLEEKVYVPGYC